ncbi:hypothetical protein NKG05_30725 [Oerskovia sp. M15]
MRIGRPRRAGIEYRGRDERPLTRALPSSPAAVRIYGDDGTCRALCLDLDVGPGGRALVDADALRLSTWLTDAGARIVTDISPAVAATSTCPWPSPLSTAGPARSSKHWPPCSPRSTPAPSVAALRVHPYPGAAHKAGGHQQLTMTLNAAVDVLMRGNSPHPRAHPLGPDRGDHRLARHPGSGTSRR